MSEEGAAKLRLKPKKALAAWSREQSPERESPRPRQPLTGRCSWFEKDDLNECEKPWTLLLKNISQDLQCTNWQTVLSFPEFLRKSSEKESLQKQEVFTIGMEDFPWVPFPSFCKERSLKPKDHNSHHLTQSPNCLLEEQSQADELHSLPCSAEQTCCVDVRDQIKNTVGEDRKCISKVDASPKSCKQQRSSVHPLALSQSSAKSFSFQQHCRGSIQNSKENREENYRKELQTQTHQGNISFGEARCIPGEETPPLVSVSGAESCKEKMENQSEGFSTLDSCPMCLMQFSGILSQMDIDGHLAKCLSESAEDVMW